MPSVVGEITTRTLAGIRREGKDRGRGQVDRVCAFCEADKTVAGQRDAALIRRVSVKQWRSMSVISTRIRLSSDRPRWIRQVLARFCMSEIRRDC